MASRSAMKKALRLVQKKSYQAEVCRAWHIRKQNPGQTQRRKSLSLRVITECGKERQFLLTQRMDVVREADGALQYKEAEENLDVTSVALEEAAIDPALVSERDRDCR